MVSYILIVSMLLVGLIPMAREAVTGRFDFFNLKNTFVIYFLLQLAVSGLVTLLVGRSSEIGLDPIAHESAYERALLVSLLGLVTFQLGYYSRPNRSLGLPGLFQQRWSRDRARNITFGYLLIGFVAFFGLMESYGGLGAFLAAREIFRAGGLVGLGFLIFPATSLMSIGAMIYLLRDPADATRRAGALRAVSVLGLALVPAVFLGFRGFLGLPVLQFMAVWNYSVRKISAGSLVAASILIVCGFTVYGISREIPAELGIGVKTMLEAITERPELAYAVVSRSKGTEVVAAVIDKLDHTGDYELGWRSLVESATIMIPKAIWPEKPGAISEKFANYFFADSLRVSRGYDLENWSGISPTVIGEWYWHFGTAGVVIGLFLLGRLAKAAYVTLRAHDSNRCVLLAYGVFYTSFTMFAESEQNYTNGLVLYAIALAVSFVLMDGRIAIRSGSCSNGP